MLGGPHAPSVVGQSPLPLEYGDPRDVERVPPRVSTAALPPFILVVPPSLFLPLSTNGSDLNPTRAKTGK